MKPRDSIAMIVLGLAVAIGVTAWQFRSCSDCELRGGVYVKGMSATGYVCVEGAR